MGLHGSPAVALRPSAAAMRCRRTVPVNRESHESRILSEGQQAKRVANCAQSNTARSITSGCHRR